MRHRGIGAVERHGHRLPLFRIAVAERVHLGQIPGDLGLQAVVDTQRHRQRHPERVGTDGGIPGQRTQGLQAIPERRRPLGQRGPCLSLLLARRLRRVLRLNRHRPSAVGGLPERIHLSCHSQGIRARGGMGKEIADAERRKDSEAQDVEAVDVTHSPPARSRGRVQGRSYDRG